MVTSIYKNLKSIHIDYFAVNIMVLLQVIVELKLMPWGTYTEQEEGRHQHHADENDGPLSLHMSSHS